MPAIRIYEAAVDRDADLRGLEADQTLRDVAENVRHLQALGADIVRHDFAASRLPSLRARPSVCSCSTSEPRAFR
jgi:hypothetical protein